MASNVTTYSIRKGWTRVRLQLDNAPAHASKKIQAAMLQACEQATPKIELIFQPACSPDTNLCDLGFFASLDCWLPKVRSYNLDALAKMVKQHFAEYDSRKLQKLCSTKDIFCRRIAEHHGDNDFVLPHHRDYGLSSEVSDEFEWSKM